MDWIEHFTLKIIRERRFVPLMSFEMTPNEREAAELLRQRGLVRSWCGFWLAGE